MPPDALDGLNGSFIKKIKKINHNINNNNDRWYFFNNIYRHNAPCDASPSIFQLLVNSHPVDYIETRKSYPP